MQGSEQLSLAELLVFISLHDGTHIPTQNYPQIWYWGLGLGLVQGHQPGGA